jgi:hypothetical protein
MPNLWKQFQDLLPTQPILIGTVITIHSDNTISVQLLGGGVLRVSGSAAENTRVLIQGGRVLGPAPDLPQIEIEI